MLLALLECRIFKRMRRCECQSLSSHQFPGIDNSKFVCAERSNSRVRHCHDPMNQSPQGLAESWMPIVIAPPLASPVFPFFFLSPRIMQRRIRRASFGTQSADTNTITTLVCKYSQTKLSKVKRVLPEKISYICQPEPSPRPPFTYHIRGGSTARDSGLVMEYSPATARAIFTTVGRRWFHFGTGRLLSVLKIWHGKEGIHL